MSPDIGSTRTRTTVPRMVATAAGELLLVRREDGVVEERYRVGAVLRTQPIVHRGWIYAGSADGRLIAVDTGRPELTGWDTWAANPGRTGRIGD